MLRQQYNGREYPWVSNSNILVLNSSRRSLTGMAELSHGFTCFQVMVQLIKSNTAEMAEEAHKVSH